MNGYLEIITGPMYSGKSTYLIDKIFKLHNTNMVVVKHHIDDRYNNDCIVTHDKRMVEALKMNKLKDIFLLKEYNELENILIDEGQFFEDLYEFIKKAVDNDKKNVYISGLLSDFERKPFDNLYKVLSLADNIVFKHGKCSDCDNESVFSKRMIYNEEQILVGSTFYKPVCRICYLK